MKLEFGISQVVVTLQHDEKIDGVVIKITDTTISDLKGCARILSRLFIEPTIHIKTLKTNNASKTSKAIGPDELSMLKHFGGRRVVRC